MPPDMGGGVLAAVLLIAAAKPDDCLVIAPVLAYSSAHSLQTGFFSSSPLNLM